MGDFGRRIKAIRGELLQEDFASIVGVHRNTVGRWERETRNPDILDLGGILRAFPDINPTWLLTGEGTMHRDLDERPAEPCTEDQIGWDPQLMHDILDEYETAMGEQKVYILPEEKAKMYVQLYELYRKDQSKIDAKEVRRTLHLIVNNNK